MGLTATLQAFFERYTFDQTRSVDKRGLGSVYLGEDKETNQAVVVKTVELHQNWDNNILVERYNNSQQYTHPNLLACLEYVKEMEGAIAQYWVALPYLEKGALSSFDVKSWSRVHRADVLEGVMDALIHLHENGMVAQNLSSDHILIKKVSDIYVPVLIQATNKRHIPLSFFSDYDYLAPEQFDENYTPSPKTDIWALGVLIYHQFIGLPPFGTRNSRTFNEQIQNRILNGKIPSRVNELPQPWQDIVEKCLILNPEERWENVTSVKEYLQKGKQHYLTGGEVSISTNNKVVEKEKKNIEDDTTSSNLNTKKTIEKKELPPRTFKRKPTGPIKWWRVGVMLVLAMVLGYFLSQWVEGSEDIPTQSKPEQDSLRLE